MSQAIVRSPTLASLRGKVVLVDFWTYSCINCLRTLPHLRSLYAAYHRMGLQIVGVHTPEFAFEHELGNVRAATHDPHVTWPVALDNAYGTWTAYSNQYWPAEYLIDRRGDIRRVHFGEGEYGVNEQAIRQLLKAPRGVHARAVPDETPTLAVTPESYLGFARLDPARYAGTPIHRNVTQTYAVSTHLAQNVLSYGGAWSIGQERAIAGLGARLRFHIHARNVYLVLGGKGTVGVRLGGRKTRSVRVDGDQLYTLLAGPSLRDTLLELRFTPGLTVYAFTFG